MAIFNSYVSLPEGKPIDSTMEIGAANMVMQLIQTGYTYIDTYHTYNIRQHCIKWLFKLRIDNII